MHRRDLGIWGEGKAGEMKRVELAFHFSDENYGDYGFFYLFNKGNTNNRRITATCD